MINLYKKVLLKNSDKIAGGKILENDASDGKKLWKSNYQLNPDVNEYGTGEAEIIDFALIDEYGNYTNCIQKGTSFTIKSKVKFLSDIQDPIFTYTFKTVQGTAVTGTNTMFEKWASGWQRQVIPMLRHSARTWICRAANICYPSAAPVMSAESSARTTDYMMWSV